MSIFSSGTKYKHQSDLKGLARTPENEALQHKVLSLIFDDYYLKRNVVLKGGAFLNVVYNSPRSSKNDLDFSVLSSVDSDKITAGLERISKKLSRENPEITHRAINGHHFSFRIDGTEVLSVQIQLNRPILRKTEDVWIMLPGISSFTITAISINEQLAEKIDALNKRQDEGKKLNDIHDIYFLIKKGATFDVALIVAKLNLGQQSDPKKAIEEMLLNNLTETELTRLWDSHTRTFLQLPKLGVISDAILDAWIKSSNAKK